MVAKSHSSHQLMSFSQTPSVTRLFKNFDQSAISSIPLVISSDVHIREINATHSVGFHFPLHTPTQHTGKHPQEIYIRILIASIIPLIGK